MTWLNKPKVVTEPVVSTEQVTHSSPTKLPTPVLLDDRSPLQDDPSSQGSPSGVRDTFFGHTAKPLPDNVELRSCTREDIPQLKNLTSLLLPIPYGESFYKEILNDPVTSSITLLAVWHDNPAMKAQQKGRLIGAIRCRLLARPPGMQAQKNESEGPVLYLSTLVLLSPYRSHGIATHLLQTLTRRAIDDYGVASVGAHVWEANTDGLEWYRKRGFHEVGREVGYYRRLDPQDAVIMQRKVSVMDVMG